MSQTSHDARAVVRALDALTTQVQRIADALPTPVVEPDDATQTPPTTTGDDAFDTLTAVPTPAPITVHIHGQQPLTGTWHGGGMGTPRGSSELVWEPTITFPRRRPPMDPVHILGAEAPAEHRGGNAEDCPACTGTNPAYPFICPGPAADEDAQRTTRRDSLRNLIDRLDRNGALAFDEGALLRQHFEAEAREGDQWRAGRNTMKRRGEEIERDRDRLAAELERSDAVTAETKRLLERRTTTLRRRAETAETELRVLRAGLRANGADPTQIQNLWAQIRLRNRQWRDAKRERDEAQAAIERVQQACHDLPYEQAQRILAALDGTEQPTTCTATIPAVINSTPDQCVAPAGHYDESNEPVFTGPERSPGGWHTNGKGHVWSDRAAAATPHVQQPTTEA